MESFFRLVGSEKSKWRQMLDFPNSEASKGFFARIKKARREVKARRRWLRAQRVQALRRAHEPTSWHPDAHPWDQESR